MFALIVVASIVATPSDPCGAGAGIPCVKLASGEEMPLVQMGSWGGSAGVCAVGNFTCLKAYTVSSYQSWFDLGGRGIDTANDYKDQVTIGQFWPTTGIRREDLFITTKCPGVIGYEATLQCVDDNMQMLNLLGDENKAVNGYIDLLLIHFPNKTPLACRFRDIDSCDAMADVPTHPTATKEQVQSTWRALEDLKKLGAVKSIGVSSFNISHLQWTQEIATEQIDVNQVNWNPLAHDDELLAFSKKHGIQLQAWSPLGGSAEFNKLFGIQGSLLSFAPIEHIAQKHHVSTAQVILRWSIQQGVAITTASNVPSHQRGDMDLWSFELTKDEMDVISSLSSSAAAAQYYNEMANPDISSAKTEYTTLFS
eukprot:gnl/TRDRNA2_/TRDRNA2_155653_c0_seq1.p1 gnl/TRDRNA2_/TRDRNA2_155653_c0~~gnl/TRDRNA2_/TRDRNA2_155653_c0_seq1.p1  ORF type:complete len:367 (-),score=55.32 gnl/TRDRNA2_/TRDRNA2_155653_c0_seq1:62-1162(-)